MWKEVSFQIEIPNDALYAFLPDIETGSNYDIQKKNRVLDEQLNSLRNELSRAKAVVNLLEEELKEKERDMLDKEKTETGLLLEAVELEKQLKERPVQTVAAPAEKQTSSAMLGEIFDEKVEYTETEEKILNADGKTGEKY